MALTQYAINSPIAVKLWSSLMFEEALKTTWWYKFTGNDSENVVQILDNTMKGPGDTITYPLRTQLVAPGVQGDGTLEGNEESLSVYTDAIIIDQLRNAVRSAGKMSEQRIPFEVRNEAYIGLRDWLAGRLDYWFFNQLGGNPYAPVEAPTAGSVDTRYTGLQAVTQYDTLHRIYPTTAITDDSGLTNTNVFNLNLIDYCVEKAQALGAAYGTGVVPIRPIRVNGEEKYVMFLHDYQVTDLRTNTATGQWFDIQKSAQTGGEITKNPIYTGAIGEYNGTILHKANRVPLGINGTTGAQIANTRRAIFCGAQAGTIAFGQENGEKASWVEELFDYGNQLGVSGGVISGMKRTLFNGYTFGSFIVPTYAAAHA